MTRASTARRACCAPAGSIQAWTIKRRLPSARLSAAVCAAGEICGALTGAVLALGAAFPFTDADDAESKVKIAALTKQSAAMFKDNFGCLRCLELKAAGKPCKELIAYGAELAEQMIIGNRGE